MEDIVISSYKQQIKESSLKAEAVKAAGFDIVVEELEKRGIKTTDLRAFFDRISNANTKEELNSLTLDELLTITNDINAQITRALIAKVEIADVLVRKSKLVALAKSPNGKVKDNDNYVKVGTNLAAEINREGIAEGLNTCIKNYCIQKIYQADYREKMIEKQKELGIYDEQQKEENKRKINQKITSTIDQFSNVKSNPKEKLLHEIFRRDITLDEEISFENAKESYRQAINERMRHLADMK